MTPDVLSAFLAGIIVGGIVGPVFFVTLIGMGSNGDDADA